MGNFDYRSILVNSGFIVQWKENRSLVIELDIFKKPSDEIYAFTSYKLYRERKKWSDAEIFCKSRGGQLASIHTKWEQALAKTAAEGEKVWLGGKKLGGEWHWVNNSTWSFTNWMGVNGRYDHLVMRASGRWENLGSNARLYFLCQGSIPALIENGEKTVMLEKQHLNFFPFHVLFKSRALNVTDEEKKISGFSLNWFLRDSNGTKVTKELPARKEDWKYDISTRGYEEPLLQDMVQLARDIRLQSLTKADILREIISKKKVNLKMKRCLNEGPIPNMTKTPGEPSDEDIKTGFELYHAAIFCPSMVVKMYNFVDQMLSKETSRTIIQTMAHLFHSGVINDEFSFNLTNQFYIALASNLDLQYGNILLATSTKAQLQAMLRKRCPFFAGNTDHVKRCLQGRNCDILQDVYHNLGRPPYYPFLN